MTQIKKYTPTTRRQALAKLTGWQKMRGREAIGKQYVFANFSASFAWMTQIALYAEKIDHHPEWFNVYNKIEVVLATHEAGGITQKDIAMARYMDKCAKALKGKPSPLAGSVSNEKVPRVIEI